jgi:hypothetical protein
MKKNLLLVGALLACFTAYAQKDKKAQDVAAIKAMCGCYEVSFEYAETFASDTAYKFAKPYKAKALEWVALAEENKDKLVLQHILAMGEMVVKHWRQDWLYENTTLLAYQQGHHWRKTNLENGQAKGQWTQNVYEVDDSPRYAGSATWVHYDGKHYWENTTDAPLPRREYTKRSDYQVMKRTNRHEITAYGWAHEQDNLKVVRSEAGDKTIAQEKGWNIYRKTEDSRCQKAKEWWEKNQAFWADVRVVWNKLIAQNAAISLEKKVEDKFLNERLEALAQESKGDSAENQAKIKAVIELYHRK